LVVGSGSEDSPVEEVIKSWPYSLMKPMIYCEKRDIITLKTYLHSKQMVRILKFLAWHAEIDNVYCSDVTSNLCTTWWN